jgi:LPXTG-motif cell wall-anchored protein
VKKRNLLVATLVFALVLIMASASAFAVQPTVEGKFLDSFERVQFAVDGNNNALSDGTTIYWNGSGANTLTIKDGVLSAAMQTGGYIRWATNNADSFKYVVIRIKGDSTATNDKIYTRIGVAESKDIDDGTTAEHSLADLKGPDGKALPAVTNEWQDLVVDLEQNGLKLGGGSNAFQLGTWQAMTLDIDYVFMTNTDPTPAATEDVKVTEPETETTDEKATETQTETITENPKTNDTTPIIPIIAVLVISAGLFVVLTRRKKIEC